jgi:ADP-heptose:LPS heptosyltransferase
MADRNYQKYPQMKVPVIAPGEICNYAFNRVVIALRTEIGTREVLDVLQKQGIGKEKTVCVYEREELDIYTTTHKKDGTEFSRSCGADTAIAILVSGGLGDNIIQKRFIKELIKYAPDVNVDLYSIRNADYLKWLYSDTPEIKYVIDDLGCRYNDFRQEYSVAMVIEACRYVRIDVIDETHLSEVYSELCKRLIHLKSEFDREDISLTTPIAVPNLIRIFKGQNAYSCFNYNGAFCINDKVVDIPISENARENYKTYGLKRYFTVNYGAGECSDPRKVAKMWYPERFEEVIACLKKSYPDIEAVQLGTDNAEHLAGINHYIFGESMDNVAAVLEHSLFHIDTEGGLVHLATQVGTKCFVLFGPSPESFYGYDNNENIKAGNCHNCIGLLKDHNRCVRGMEFPECMDRITAEMVYKRVVAYLEEASIDG